MVKGLPEVEFSGSVFLWDHDGGHYLVPKIIQRSNSETLVVGSVFPEDHNGGHYLWSKVIQRSKSETWMVGSVFPGDHNGGSPISDRRSSKAQILTHGWCYQSSMGMIEVVIWDQSST